MTSSIEALAMAGVDCVEWGIDVEEWEREDSEPPPPHLLAGEEEEEEELKELRRDPSKCVFDHISHFSEDCSNPENFACIGERRVALMTKEEQMKLVKTMVEFIVKLLRIVRMDTTQRYPS